MPDIKDEVLKGFEPDEIKPEDYIFGGGRLPMEEIQPDGYWTNSLPVVEIQELHGVEPYGCVSFTILTSVEILIKEKYDLERNYSDRFLAAISGTRERKGNSPGNVADVLKHKGVVLQDVWPFNKDINTYEKFYGEIPQNIIDLAKEFNEEWDFGYERVPSNPEAISAALKCSPLLISVYAWTKNDKGLYYRPEGYSDIHATTMIAEREGEYRRVFDTYEPHIKDYDWNSMPIQVMRFWIEKKGKKKEERGEEMIEIIPMSYYIKRFFQFIINIFK